MQEKKTLVLGASVNPNRYANKAIKMLVDSGVETKAHGLREGLVHGVQISNKLVLHSNINTISIYLNPKRQREYYDYIISLKPTRVIFNPGTENVELKELLLKENIAFEDACTLVLLATKQF